MKDNKQHFQNIIKNGDLDFISLIKFIWNSRKIIFYTVAICIFFGLLVAFLKPVMYKASATLLPSTQKQSSSLGNLSSLASMTGLNLGSIIGQTEGISIDIYPQIVNSYPFLNDFIHEKFMFEDFDESISIYDYVVSDTVNSKGGSKLFQYTLGLPWTIKEALFSKKEKRITKEIDYGVINLTDEELMAINLARDLLQIEVEKKTGLVNVSALAEEPILVAQYVQKGVALLQNYIIAYKTKQVKQNLDFVQERYDEKKKEYELVQNKYFNYKDSHRNVISERVDSDFQILSDEYDIASAVYKSIAQQLEQAKIAVKEQTPVFAVLEPVKVPTNKYSPNRKIILVLSVFVGVFLGICIVFVKNFFGILNLKKEEDKEL